MKTSILPKRAAWTGICLGFMSWAGVAQAGHVDEAVVDVYPGSAWSAMSGTTYGTRLAGKAGYMGCELLGDIGHAAGLGIGYCSGQDAQGDRFHCQTSDLALLQAIQTLPDYGRIAVYATGNACTDLYSYRGSSYLPRGRTTGQQEIDVHGSVAEGSFYGARVSSDVMQYAECTVYDSATYSFTWCQATDAAGDFFYCSTDIPGMVDAARSLSNYSSIYLNRDPSYQCTEIRTHKNTSSIP